MLIPQYCSLQAKSASVQTYEQKETRPGRQLTSKLVVTGFKCLQEQHTWLLWWATFYSCVAGIDCTPATAVPRCAAFLVVASAKLQVQQENSTTSH